MQTYNTPALFDETQLVPDEQAFLDYQDFRMRSIGQQLKLEIGRILKETRDWFRTNHKRGFEDYVQKQWGISPQHARRLIDAFDELVDQTNLFDLGLALSAQLALKEAPNQQAAIDEVKIRQELEEKITAKKAKEIADYQHNIQIARDEKRSEQERATAIERQLAYVKQQLATAQQPKTVVKEVVPQQVRDRLFQLEERQRQLTRERDSYHKQLDEERATSYAKQTERREGENADRIRALFAEATRDYLRFTRVFLSKLPSLADTAVFEADDWQRLNEVREVMNYLEKELDKFILRPNEPTQLRIVDAMIVEEG